MAPHSSTLPWKIPWMEEPGWLQSMGSLRVGHNWVTSLSFFTFMHWRRKWQPTPCSCLENPRDGGAWWAAVYGVAQSRTRLMWLSSSSSILFFKILLKNIVILYKIILRTSISKEVQFFRLKYSKTQKTSKLLQTLPCYYSFFKGSRYKHLQELELKYPHLYSV